MVTSEQQVPENESLPAWAPPGVDTESPNAARVYDYWLGGAHNFAADREFGDRVKCVIPAEYFALMNRAFLGRVVRYLVNEAGIRQILDLGSGVPTVGNVHEIAQDAVPDCRVVYVDNEPVAVAHSELILEGNSRAAIVAADLRDPHAVMSHPDTRRLIDFTEPVAVIMCAVLHFIPDDDDPAGIVADYGDSMAPGSFLAISHATADDYPEDLAEVVMLYERTSTPATLRTHRQICDLFEGFTLLSPGVVFTPLWRPDTPPNGEDPRRSLCYGGVGVL